jgi:hypothetical protein
MDAIMISSTEAARHLGDYLSRVKHKGETFILTKNDKPIAELAPVAGSGKGTWGELKAAMVGLQFDENFANDLEQVNEVDQLESNPWD